MSNSEKIPEYARQRNVPTNTVDNKYTSTREELRKRLRMDSIPKPTGTGIASNLVSSNPPKAAGNGKSLGSEEGIIEQPAQVLKWDLKQPSETKSKKTISGHQKKEIFNSAEIQGTAAGIAVKISATGFIKDLLSIENLVLFFACFLFGGGKIFGTYTPFVVVALVISFGHKKVTPLVSCLFGAFLGIALFSDSVSLLAHLLAGLIIFFVCGKFIREMAEDPQDQRIVTLVALATLGCSIFGKSVVYFAFGNGADFFSLGIIEGMIGAAIVAIVVPYFLILQKRKYKKIASDAFDMASMLIVGFGICLGLQQISVYGINIGRIFALLCASGIGFIAGPSAGCITGVVMALSLVMGGTLDNPTIAICLAATGLFSGLLKKLPIFYSMMLLGAASMLSLVDVSGDFNLLMSLLETFILLSLFLLIPYKKIRHMLSQTDFSGTKLLKLDEKAQDNIFIQRIEKLKSLFIELSNGMDSYDVSKYDDVFVDLVGGEDKYAYTEEKFDVGSFESVSKTGVLSKNDGFEKYVSETKKRNYSMKMASLVADVCDSSCVFCSKQSHCWDGNFFKTYRDFNSALALYELNGSMTKDELPHDLKKRCIRQEKLVEAIDSVASFWGRKLDCDVPLRDVKQEMQIRSSEGVFTLNTLRQVFSMELSGLIKAMDELAQGLRIDGSQEEEIRQDIFRKLVKIGLDVKELLVKKHKAGIEIEITKSACQKDQECINAIVPLISNYTGQNLMLWRSECCCGLNKVDCGVKEECSTKCKECKLVLMPSVKYQIEVDVLQLSRDKEPVCGDSTLVRLLGDGRMVVAIADGMGTGTSASRESKAALKMLSKLLEMGLDGEFAVQTVNLMMLMRSREDSFTTIDLLLIDLFTGKAGIIKAGSPLSILKKQKEVLTLGEPSLPAGVFIPLKIESTIVDLDEDDVLVMTSDGVIDCCDNITQWNEKINKIIKYSGNTSVEEISQAVLQLGCGVSSRTFSPKDDITILTSKLKKVKGNSCVTPVVVNNHEDEKKGIDVQVAG